VQLPPVPSATTPNDAPTALQPAAVPADASPATAGRNVVPVPGALLALAGLGAALLARRRA
jgi:hypothetical protein